MLIPIFDWISIPTVQRQRIYSARLGRQKGVLRESHSVSLPLATKFDKR
jgi:hypothetical protein